VWELRRLTTLWASTASYLLRLLLLTRVKFTQSNTPFANCSDYKYHDLIASIPELRTRTRHNAAPDPRIQFPGIKRNIKLICEEKETPTFRNEHCEHINN
jgi:hypothetical protein